MSKTAIYAIICCYSLTMAFGTESAAQRKLLSEISIDLHEDHSSLINLIREIESVSDFTFMYAKKELAKRRVNISDGHWNMSDLLTQISGQAKVSIKRVNETIAVTVDEDQLPGFTEEIFVDISISGKITDENGEGLPGATILEKGTTNGTTTNIDGTFQLSSPENAVLIISFVGYQTQEIAVNNRSVIDVQLTVDAEQLEEVVVIGYGEVKKSDLTGSVASVSKEDLKSVPTGQLARALQGRAAGVQVLQNTGAPGSSMQVRIRGVNSISGNNEPLWIIDGFQGDPNTINPNDIASMEILKDASATAIYGSRGANGVIIITTNSGKAGETTVTYEGSYGIQSNRKKLDVLDAQEYMRFVNIQQVNDLGTPYFSDDDIANAQPGTDWQDLYYQNAPIQNHSITVNGGGDKTRVSMSGGILDQDGIVLGSYYKRKTLRSKVEHDISSVLSVLLNINLSSTEEKNDYASGGFRSNTMLSSILTAPPTVSPYNDDGTYNQIRYAYPFMSDAHANPESEYKERKSISKNNRITLNGGFTFKPIDGLTFDISGNYISQDGRNDSYTTLLFPGSQGSGAASTSKLVQLASNNVITYNKSFGDHDLTLTGGLTYEEATSTGIGISGSGFLSDATENYAIGSAAVVNNPSSSFSKWQLLSYIGRMNYVYKGKYYATFSFRADGSSRYSEGDKWGYFPSGALAYKISQEDFMSGISAISDLKIRAGYGETGSTAISPYTTLNMLNPTPVVFNDASYTSFEPSSRFPAPLQWESTAQTDFGIDLSMFNYKVGLTVDYYVKNTQGLLNSVQLPSSSGYSNTIQNIGKMQNKGIELQLDVNAFDDEFKWDISGNISFNKNEVVELYDGQDILAPNLNITVIVDYLNLVREGQPMNVFYGYIGDGFDDTGNFKYLDLNDDGSITSEDRDYIGNPNPDFIYGFTSKMSWKNFDFDFFIQGSQGNDIYALGMAAQTIDFGQGLSTIKDILYDHWTPENPDAKYPKISTNSRSKISDMFVYDGSYLRLKNVQLGYNIDLSRMGINFIKKGKIYVSGQNLLTITSYPWQDPEINSFGGGNSLRQGIDHYSYPVAKSVIFGVRLDF